ncbi:hypothetical protein BTM25_11440 [Actinomadura rubteroloni]|uniref:Uncharacterized protein n=1 Tax=Actinomadura rubteroloni TaxID=1926885 RepID=A0A2P4UNW4_9ACTN|nr:hypothetical protein [Actinomadura rubteroloni]POM26738.1 hypothetical protein BTM25_11440 [Actinomadura rubteroloni]
MSFISFSLDPEFRMPLYHATDEKYRTLGAWILADISTNKRVALDALATIADVEAGRPHEPWDSENYTVGFGAAGIEIQNDWVPNERGAYSLAELKEAIETYWKFLVSIPDNPDLIREFRPDLPEWQAAVLAWEDTWKRPHPCRGVLF